MIPQSAILRIARSTQRLQQVAQMYVDSLGFDILSRFTGHDGFDGIILGHRHHPYHLEFVFQHGAPPEPRPSAEHLLVFYLPRRDQWEAGCASLAGAGFTRVAPNNPYWNRHGASFADIDGYRVVLQNEAWTS